MRRADDRDDDDLDWLFDVGDECDVCGNWPTVVSRADRDDPAGVTYCSACGEMTVEVMLDWDDDAAPARSGRVWP